MKDYKADSGVRVDEQVERMRKLYSQIGEALPEEICEELKQQLGRALELADKEPKRTDKRRLDA